MVNVAFVLRGTADSLRNSLEINGMCCEQH
jgi:hypothetical protein